MKFISTFLFFSILYNHLCAQATLSGTVSNSANKPIAFAGLTLQRLNANQKQSVQTDTTGAFAFRKLAPGQYTLTTSFIGYKQSELTLTITRDTTLRILLTVSNTQLKEMVITANKAVMENTPEKLVYQVSSGVLATGSDVLTAISQMPGVKVNDNEISIAGKGTVKVMVNNRRVQLAGLELIRYLKSLAANQISTIELMKNPSANFDAEGNAGLINITTRQSKKPGYSGNVQLNAKHWLHHQWVIYGTSNYEAINSSANLTYHTEKWSAYGSVNFDQDHHLEGFETEVHYPRQTWQLTDTGNYWYHNVNMVAGADYTVSPKTTVGMAYFGGRNNYDGADNVNNPIYQANGAFDSTIKTHATYYPIAINNSINLHTAINFDTVGRKLLLNADFFSYYRTDRSDFESNTYLADDLLNPSGTTRYFDTNKQNIKVYTFKADAEIPTRFAKIALGGKLSFINTYSNAFYYNKNEQNELTYNTELSNEFDYTENTQSLYVSLQKEGKKWKYQAGLRAELTETKGYSYTLQQSTTNNYLKLFPSLSVSYQADKANDLTFTFGRRINRPTFWNLNPFKSLYTAYSYGQGNPYLRPEYNSNVELAHTFKGALTSSLFLNMTDNGFANVILASADTNLVVTIPLNFINTYRFGVSESISLQLANWLDNNNQISFYRTKTQSKINSINGIQGFGLYLATNNTIYFDQEKTFAGAVNFWYQFPEVDHFGRSHPYYKLDLGIKAVTFKKRLDIALTFNDVLRSSASSVSSTVNDIPQKFTNFQFNRYVLLGISYRFGNNEAKSGIRDTGNQDEKKRVP